MKKIIFFTAAVTFALTFGVALAQDGNARDMSGTTSNNDAGMSSSPGAGDSLGTGGTSTGLGTGGTSTGYGTGGAGGLGTGGTTTGMGTGGTGTSLGTGGTGTSGTGGPGM